VLRSFQGKVLENHAWLPPDIFPVKLFGFRELFECGSSKLFCIELQQQSAIQLTYWEDVHSISESKDQLQLRKKAWMNNLHFLNVERVVAMDCSPTENSL
jgi:hypothetical protein